jgi:hypothetical protein
VRLGGDNKAVYQVMHGMNNNIKSRTLQPQWQDDYNGIEMYLQGSGRGVVQVLLQHLSVRPKENQKYFSPDKPCFGGYSNPPPSENKPRIM